jgi:uncharacterized protein YlxW (UPF0749 family)
MSDLEGKVETPRWMLALMVSISMALGGAAGSGVTLASSPDLEITKRQAIDEAVAEARRERRQDLEAHQKWLSERLARLEDHVSSVNDKLDRMEGATLRPSRRP